MLLGSFPGVASLKTQQYYGHPRNQFWRLLDDVFDLSLVGLAYEERLLMLRRHRIALWDVITETEREGSLDSNIRDPLHSDLGWLLAHLPRLETIGFNGGTAAGIGRRQLAALGEPRWRILSLPSSSPAYTLPYDAKLKAWQSLRQSSP